ncbi:MAG: TatD family hydrolase [Bacillota bacterium]
MELFDTHCHLADRAYARDLDEVLARARASGVVGLACVGYDVASSRAAVELAGRHDHVWAVVGVHPHHAREAGRDFIGELRLLARRPRVVAIGEAGLDFYRDLSPRPVQKDVFRRQVDLALELGLPLVVHDRDAHEETLDVLSRAYGGSRPGDRPIRAGVMHCFAGDAAKARVCLDLGFHLSFAGPITFPKAERAREAAAATPLGSLLVETDCPYLAPQSRRGRRNEPAFVVEVAAALAAVKGVAPEEAAARTTENARRLFGLA